MGTVLVKLGGSTLGSGDTSLEDLVALQGRGVPTVVVHGGGKEITAWLTRLRVESRFVRGLRVTSEEAMPVVVAVLAGVVNKGLVAKLNALGGKALGLSGADGWLLEARVQDPELGLVGEIVRVNPEPVKAALEAGYIPVIAPIGADREGRLLNVNADTAAGELAHALGAERLVFLTDVPGIQDQSGEVIPVVTQQDALALVAQKVIDGGMLPKVEACFQSGTRARIIDGRQPHALLRELAGEMPGTTVKGVQ